MAAKKRAKGKVAGPPSATAEGRFSILIEQVLDQSRGTFEAVRSLEQKMEKRFEEAEERNDRRFGSLEAAVRINSADIRKNSEDIRGLQAKLDSVVEELKALSARVDRIEALLAMKPTGPSAADLDARIRRIEERLGLL